MKFNMENVNVEFVGGKGEYLYQPVLEDIPNAHQIRLLTYNMEQYNKKSELYNTLHKIQEDADFKWIFNIPNRDKEGKYQKKYQTQDGFLDTLKRTMNTYTSIIESKEFLCEVKAAENDENHAKIFGTENVLYIGSQNFSEASKNNYEVGVIIRDKNYIQKIYKNFFDPIYNANGSIKRYKSGRIWKIVLHLNLVIDLLVNMVSDTDMAETFDNIYAESCYEHAKKLLREIVSDLENLSFGKNTEILSDIAWRLSDIYTDLDNDSDVQDLLHYDFIDACAEIENDVKDKYEDWASERDSQAAKLFDNIHAKVSEKSYLDDLSECMDDIKNNYEELENLVACKNPNFKNELDNTPKQSPQ